MTTIKAALVTALVLAASAASSASEVVSAAPAAKEVAAAVAVSETDPSRYSPQRLSLDGQGRPVYPLPRSVPNYPNRLQLDRDGRVVYPSPERTAAAVAPSLAEVGAEAAGAPEYLLTPEALGVGGFNNLDPFNPSGKLRSMGQYIEALQRRAIMQAAGAGPGQVASVRDPASVPQLQHPEQYAFRSASGATVLPPVVLGLLEEDASAVEPGQAQQPTEQGGDGGGGLQTSTRLNTVPEYTLMPENVPYSAYTNADPFDPGRLPLDAKRQLQYQRATELQANPGFQGTPSFLPPPGAYLGLVETFAVAGCHNCEFHS